MPLTGGKEGHVGFLADLKMSLDKGVLERKYSSERQEGKFTWFDPASKMIKSDKLKPSALKGVIGVHVSTICWRSLANVIEDSKMHGESRLVLSVPKSSGIGLKRLVDVTNWYEEQRQL